MKRRIARGMARRGFLTGALAAGLTAVVHRGRRTRVRGAPERPPGRRGRGARPAEPWVPLREEVISVDELKPSGRDLAG